MSPLGAMIGTTWWNPGLEWNWRQRITGQSNTSNPLYALVAQETASLYAEMMKAEGWTQPEIFVGNCNRIPSKLAFRIISRCGFGIASPWADDESDTKNLSLGACISIVTREFMYRLVLPQWVFRLPIKKMRSLHAAWTTLKSSMHNLVEECKQTSHNAIYRGDVFSRVVESLDSDAKVGLEESEATGNIYSLMFAGSETTAHALSATIAMLAIHQEAQSKVYSEITRKIPVGSQVVCTLRFSLGPRSS
ncbi:hypothetical protein EIP86_010428 [Pleurotus ostreatoroseus]|nr:hypothetical protein EIP86_010428 [Pleurotus ostreatoroseus]